MRFGLVGPTVDRASHRRKETTGPPVWQENVDFSEILSRKQGRPSIAEGGHFSHA